MGIDTGRTLILFNFNSIPKNIKIKKITLSLFAYPYQAGSTYLGHSGDNNSTLIQRIISTWNKNSVTWNKKPNVTTQNQVFLGKTTNPFQDFTNIDVTDLFLPMILDNSQNFGIQMKLEEELPKNVMIFCSTDFFDQTKHPKLTIFYEDDYPKIDSTSTNNIPNIKGNCTSEESFFIPNTFSPNNDGINDYFTIFSKNEVIINRLQIFDRWGNLVFENNKFPTNDSILGWDGTFRERPCSIGAYTYSVKLSENKGCSATAISGIMLMR